MSSTAEGHSHGGVQNSLCEAPSAWRGNYSMAAAWFLEVAATCLNRLDHPALGEWSVRELLGHTGRAFTTVTDYLGADGTVDVAGAEEYFRLARTADPAAIAARGKAAGAELGDEPVGTLRRLAERTARSLEDAADDALVRSPFGVMTLAEYLPTRTFEFVVHTCDLTAATGLPLAPPAAPATSAMRLAGALAGPRVGEVLLALTGRRTLDPGFSVISDRPA